MVERWLEDSGISFGCEEVGPIDVVDLFVIRKAGTLAFVGIEDEAPLIVSTLYLPSIHAG
jgi:hypothetical protein